MFKPKESPFSSFTFGTWIDALGCFSVFRQGKVVGYDAEMCEHTQCARLQAYWKATGTAPVHFQKEQQTTRALKYIMIYYDGQFMEHSRHTFGPFWN